MIFAVLFEDNEENADMRPKHMAEHLAFLERHAQEISAAGPLTNINDQTPAGGLWLVEAENAEAVWTLIHEDPFWPTGLRHNVRLLQWTQVFADGCRRVA